MNSVPMADDPFNSALLKLGRANDYANAAQDAFKAFVDSHPYALSVETHKKRRGLIKADLVVAELTPFNFQIALLVGDAAHNARSALDHLMFVLASPKTEKENGQVEFPIHNTKQGFRNNWRRQMPGVKRGIPTVVESLQPYHRRKWPETQLLWTLKTVNNIDKHRTLPISFMASFQNEVTLIVSDDIEVIESKGRVFQRIFEPGAVIASFYTKPPRAGAKMQMNAKMGLVPILSITAKKRRLRGRGGTKLIATQPMDTVKQAAAFIESEIIPRFRRFV